MEAKTMKKNYKDYKKIYIGESERAELTLRFFNSEKKAIDCQGLHFGCDGAFEAYIIMDADAAIPGYYQLVFESTSPWLDIIDDIGLSCYFSNLENIKIYRAGNYGCIIVLKHLK